MEIPRLTDRVLLISLLLLTTIFSLLLFRTGWLCDDAYITFRTIDNFMKGYGLRWNVIERVQSYTHPLWMFLLAGLYSITREIYFTSIITSIVISILTVVLLFTRVSRSAGSGQLDFRYYSILGLLVLIFSKAYIDFSTSGLENALSHLIIVVFGIVYIREEWGSKKIFLLSLVGSLGILTRMDTVLLYGPAFLYALWKERSPRGILIAFIGSLPFILWELFSIMYYGFPFPNTAYAKLGAGITDSELLVQGFRYFLNSFLNDPVTLIVICSGMIFPIIVRRKEYIPLSVGVLLYCIYVAKIGGDFMSGRFFTPPLMVSVVIIMGIGFTSLWRICISCLVVVIAGLVSPHPTIFSKTNYGIEYSSRTKDNIYDERASYYPYTSMEKKIRGFQVPQHPWIISGREAGENKVPLVIRHSIGFFGYAAGPGVYIVDRWSLTDPLLARLPAGRDWQIGHYRRRLPDGYPESILTDTIAIKDPDLTVYYRKLRTIIRGDIFSLDRLKEIWLMNTGADDYLLEKYRASQKSQ